MNFYPFHIGDYASATRHLSWDEDLAYRRLIDAYYTREVPIPTDRNAAYRLVLAATPAQKRAVDSVLAEFFTESPDGFVHARCEYEIEEAKTKSKKAASSATARWEQLRMQSERSANAEQTQSEGNAPNTITTPITQSTPKTISSGYPEMFEMLWAEYPKRPGANKQSTYRAWKARIEKNTDPALMLAGVMAYATYCYQMRIEPKFIKQPATFLGPDKHFESDWTAPAVRAGPLSAAEDRQRASELLTGRNRGNGERTIDGTATVVA